MYFYNLQVDILLIKIRQIVLTDASPSDRRRRKILPHNTETRERETKAKNKLQLIKGVLAKQLQVSVQ